METEAERIAVQLAEHCARWSRGDPELALALAKAIVSKFLEAVRQDCGSPLYEKGDVSTPEN